MLVKRYRSHTASQHQKAQRGSETMRAKIATRESAISGFVLGRIFTFRRPCTLVRAPAWAGAVLSTDGLELTLNGTPPLYAMGDYNIILEEMHTYVIVMMWLVSRFLSVCMCVCVCERESMRERGGLQPCCVANRCGRLDSVQLCCEPAHSLLWYSHDMRAIVLNVSPQRAHTCVAAAVALMVALMIVVSAINFVLNKAAAGTVEPFGAQSMSSGTGAGAPLPTR